VKVAADFESELSNIEAVSGASAAEMTKFKDLAVELGASTKFSATEAAQGITELLKAGVSTTDVLNGGLSGALSLATAGEIGLADAAEIASTALN
ncbi:phage tail tape measure protein, partial [Listeria seeligeri]